MYFPWTICDYSLTQAVEDRIVKTPIIVTRQFLSMLFCLHRLKTLLWHNIQ